MLRRVAAGGSLEEDAVNDIIKLITGLIEAVLGLLGLASKAQKAMPVDSKGLDPDSPDAYADLQFDLTQGEMSPDHMKQALEPRGLTEKQARALLKAYEQRHVGNEAFFQRVSQRIAERTQALMSQDPMQIAAQYANWKEPGT